jgi:muramoyltetrapeptide carboxypeptidase LdcA involved in peptidoglycan recycling
LDEYFQPLDVPVISGVPVGHTQHNLALPMGALVELDATNSRVRVCENPVTGDA